MIGFLEQSSNDKPKYVALSNQRHNCTRLSESWKVLESCVKQNTFLIFSSMEASYLEAYVVGHINTLNTARHTKHV